MMRVVRAETRFVSVLEYGVRRRAAGLSEVDHPVASCGAKQLPTRGLAGIGWRAASGVGRLRRRTHRPRAILRERGE